MQIETVLLKALETAHDDIEKILDSEHVRICSEAGARLEEIQGNIMTAVNAARGSK